MRTTSVLLLAILLEGASALEMKVSEKKVAKEPSLEAVRIPESEPRPIFYAIIMGKLAFRHQVSLWLSSVRKLGGYKDAAVIVTDKPTCLAKTLEEAKLLGAKLHSDADVDIYGPGAGFTGNVHIVKRPSTGSILKMKLEKARAWLNVGVAKIPHPVSSIIYTDEDMVIAKDLTKFIAEVRELEKKKHTLALFRDTGLSAGELHTGVVVIFPGKHTDECLQAWGKKLTGVQIGSPDTSKASFKVNTDEEANVEIEEGSVLREEAIAMGPDQQALGKTKPCKRSPDHDGIKILPGSFFWLPTPGGLKKDKKIEFVHFTNTGRWKRLGKTTIKAYLTRIGIPEEIDPTGHVSDKACSDADLPQTVE